MGVSYATRKFNIAFSGRYGACPACGSSNVDAESKAWKTKVDKWHWKREQAEKRDLENSIIQHEARRSRLPF